MNYFAHASLAIQREPEPAFALGAMLPDFAQLARARIVGLDHPALAAGARFHHESDAAFHAAPRFLALQRDAVAELEAAGLTRGPARGAAHVGVELLLDGALVGAPERDAGYLAALASAPQSAPRIRWREPEADTRYARVLEHLERQGVPHGYADPEIVAQRVARALANRPRLRLDAAHSGILVRWLRSARARVADASDELLDQTRAGIRRAAA